MSEEQAVSGKQPSWLARLWTKIRGAAPGTAGPAEPAERLSSAAETMTSGDETLVGAMRAAAYDDGPAPDQARTGSDKRRIWFWVAGGAAAVALLGVAVAVSWKVASQRGQKEKEALNQQIAALKAEASAKPTPTPVPSAPASSTPASPTSELAPVTPAVSPLPNLVAPSAEVSQTPTSTLLPAVASGDAPAHPSAPVVAAPSGNSVASSASVPTGVAGVAGSVTTAIGPSAIPSGPLPTAAQALSTAPKSTPAPTPALAPAASPAPNPLLSGDCSITMNSVSAREKLKRCLMLNPDTAERMAGMAPRKKEPLPWGYSGTLAPEHWAGLKPAYQGCGSGKMQAPINIVGQVDGGAPPLAFHYQPVPATIFNNGHAVEAVVTVPDATPPSGKAAASRKKAPGAAWLTLGGQRYDLVQVVLRTPSETQINGRSADMAAQLVHKSSTGQRVVVELRLNRGAANAALAPVLAVMPSQPSPDGVALAAPLDLSGLLGKVGGYLVYEGSLSVPPCTEGVIWVVPKATGTISDAQYQGFLAVYPFNARPVQPLQGRKVREALVP